MIAKTNLETKRKALTERASKLAFEKIACFERIDAIGRELEQIALLGKVMDVTLDDMGLDSAMMTAMAKKIDGLERDLASEIGCEPTGTSEASEAMFNAQKDGKTSAGKMASKEDGDE